MRVLIILTCLIWSYGIANAQDCEPNDGKKQSPVNINSQTVKITSEKPLKWSKEYGQSQSWELHSTGHTLQLESRFNVAHVLSGGSLEASYTFQQLHFHWATNNFKGSEHTINNFSFPLELHVVHTQTENPKANQYTVVAYFFGISAKDNRAMSKILAPALEAAKETNQPQEVKPFALSELLLRRSGRFYSYDGSLTTPPYTESVNWIIYAEPIFLSQKQMNIFRAAAQIEPEMRNNYRCVQNLNGRKIKLVTQNQYFKLGYSRRRG